MTCNVVKKAGASAQRRSLIKDQRGLSTVEYALLFVLIVGGSAALWSQLGGDLNAGLTRATTTYGTAIR